jgi:hypothetical protein
MTSSATKQSSFGGAELDCFACARNDGYLPQKYSITFHRGFDW